METQASFGARARRLRGLVPELTSRGVDTLTKLHPGHFWQIEQGNRDNPTRDTVVAIACLFGVTTDYLLTGEGPEPTADDVRAAVERARRAQDANTIADDAPLAATGS